MAETINYENKSLPELYFEASKKGIEHFFPKNEKEMVELLKKWDMENPTVKPASERKPMGKSMKAAVEATSEDIDDILDVDATDAAEEAPVIKKGPAPSASTKKTNRTDVVETSDVDDILGDLDDAAEEVEAPAPTAAKKKAAAPVAEEAPVSNALDDDLVSILEDGTVGDTEDAPVAKPVTSSKGNKAMAPKVAPTAPAKKAPVAAPAPAKKAPAPAAEKATNGTEGMSPYQSSSAGHFVFIALKKGGTMETVAANANKLIAKYKVKPPSDINGKIKIIYGEINAGKKDKSWGKFATDDKGRISAIAA